MAAQASSAVCQPRLTLIVAATHPDMGIGLCGSLPWPSLRAEMAYFARVTCRAPPGSINAVVMGRRTWESIPPRFRPLKGRLNVVLTRTPGSVEDDTFARAKEEGPFPASSLDDALAFLRRDGSPEAPDTLPGQDARNERKALGRTFVIGGAEIYRAVLKSELVDRVLLTRVHTRFQCDTFFPLKLRHSDGDAKDGGGATAGWSRRSAAQLDRWVGEGVQHGLISEEGVEWEAEMWERTSPD